VGTASIIRVMKSEMSTEDAGKVSKQDISLVPLKCLIKLQEAAALNNSVHFKDILNYPKIKKQATFGPRTASV
jgi:hypothetical protein